VWDLAGAEKKKGRGEKGGSLCACVVTEEGGEESPLLRLQTSMGKKKKGRGGGGKKHTSPSLSLNWGREKKRKRKRPPAFSKPLNIWGGKKKRGKKDGPRPSKRNKKKRRVSLALYGGGKEKRKKTLRSEKRREDRILFGRLENVHLGKKGGERGRPLWVGGKKKKRGEKKLTMSTTLATAQERKGKKEKGKKIEAKQEAQRGEKRRGDKGSPSDFYCGGPLFIHEYEGMLKGGEKKEGTINKNGRRGLKEKKRRKNCHQLFFKKERGGKKGGGDRL